MSDKWLVLRVKSGDSSGEVILAVLRGIIQLLVSLLRVIFLWPLWLYRSISDQSASVAGDLQESYALFLRVRELRNASPVASLSSTRIAEVLTDRFIEQAETAKPPAPAVSDAFRLLTECLLEQEGITVLPEVDWSRSPGLEEGVRLRTFLTRQERFLSDFDHKLDTWASTVDDIVAGTIAHLPSTAFVDEDGTDALPFLSVPLIEVVEDPAELIERIVITLFGDDLSEAGLFADVARQLDRNLIVASGMPPDTEKVTKPLVLPTQAKGKSPRDLVETYLRGTPFVPFFQTALPFPLPEEVRFEHTHILGGTGHGKTQLLKLLIHHDLMRLRERDGSLVVIESQGDLVGTISHLQAFAPSQGSLADRLVIVDPNDVEYPLSLNLFDINRERLTGYGRREREVILNGIVELFEYLFGALLGAELTQKQGLLFRYLARLLIVIPEATIYTLVSLMENPKPYREYIALLDRASRSFFETQFFDPSFTPTRKQILRRLWGVLSNPTFERIFSHPKNSLDLFEELNRGKVILISTAKDLLKKEGAEIFGRFFIAMIAQATLERSVLRASERVPTFVYIDEAHEYIDERIEELLNQARKYRVGLVLAHQHLDQLTTAERASFMANASIKMAGGVSAKDARALKEEIRATEEFILSARKHEMDQTTEFVCHVKNVTPHALKVTVPLGVVDALPRMRQDEYATLVDRNRERYCTPLRDIAAFPEPTAPITAPYAAKGQPDEVEAAPVWEPVPALIPKETIRPPKPQKIERVTPKKVVAAPPQLGRGGPQHKYLQELIKQAAEARGFRATIEEQIEGGSVDVALSRGGIRVACEISVTTAKDHEIGNIEKCLAAGYQHVLVVAPRDRRLDMLRKAFAAQPTAGAERVRFLLPEDLVSFLDRLVAERTTSEETVRGWRVKVKQQTTTDADARVRKEAIASVIAKSLREIKDDA